MRLGKCKPKVWAGRLAVSDMLVKCWQYLKENGNQAPLQDPEVSAVRAVIFLLDAQKHPEQCDIVDHFEFLSDAGQ